MAEDKNKGNDPVIARNRKAFHDYEILETMEAGLELHGTEVKSCRMGSVQLQESFARVEKGQLFVYGLHISPYSHGNRFNHEAMRARRLLMHKREILKLSIRTRERGCSLIPLKMYLKRGYVKIELGLAQGKTFSDKRETLRRKQDEMDMRRAAAPR
jgi:SsrA-binding protein